MRKFCSILLLLFLISLRVYAKDNIEKTLYCSYIVSGTDIYFKLEPITVKSNGNLVMENKIIGKVIEIDNNSEELIAALGGGGTWSLETKRMLSIYTKIINDDIVYSFGSCQAK